MNVCSYSSSAAHSVCESVDTQVVVQIGQVAHRDDDPLVFALRRAVASVSDSVAAVIGVCPAEVMIVSNGTPSRCSAACQETKSGSVVEVPSSSTFMSMR